MYAQIKQNMQETKIANQLLPRIIGIATLVI